MRIHQKKTYIGKIMAICFWLVAWQMISGMIANPILLVGPIETACELGKLVITLSYWKIVGTSMLRIVGGFCLAYLAGTLLGIGAYCSKWVKYLLQPVIHLMKSIPVAAFIILLLVWLGSSRNLSLVVAFIMVLPIIYLSTLEGLCATDPELLEMASIYHMPKKYQIWYLYRPAWAMHILATTRTALGISWKAGVAAEVIGISASSIGAALYQSKLYLDTAQLFAWTVTILCISGFCEWIFLLLMQRIFYTNDGGIRI